MIVYIKEVSALKVVGIVAEYNPFHNGHKYHIEKAKAETGCNKCVVVMSGSFVQRGECAVFDKWSRTRAALLNGADAVIELPVFFSTASAEFFAASSVDLLNKLGCVDYLAFGSESGNLSKIQKTAEVLLNEEDIFKSTLKSELDKGVSFPAARSLALEKTAGTEKNFLSSPNNILAVEYVKALISGKSKIKPCAVKRIMTGYNSFEAKEGFASATALRKMLRENKDVCEFMPYNFCGISPVFSDELSSMLNYRLRTMSPEELSEISDISEGLENRILQSASQCSSFDEIADFVKSKRYTRTRIERALLHIILNITKTDFKLLVDNGLNQYIRLLGFKKDSADLLKEISKSCSVPLITTVKSREELSPLGKMCLEKERVATDLYFLMKDEADLRRLNADLTTPMVII